MRYTITVEIHEYPNMTKYDKHVALHDVLDAITNHAEVVDFEEVPA